METDFRPSAKLVFIKSVRIESFTTLKYTILNYKCRRNLKR